MKIKKKTLLIWFILIVLVSGYFLFLESDYPADDYGNYNDSLIEEENDHTQIEDQFSNVEELHWGHMPLTYKVIDGEICEGIQLRAIKNSFEILENLTDGYVSFVESGGNVDIDVYCIDREKEIEKLKEHKICSYHVFNYSKTSLSTYEEGILNIETQRFVSARTLIRTEEKTIYEVCYIDIQNVTFSFNFDALGEGGPNYLLGNVIVNSSVNIFKLGESWTTCTSFPTKEMHEILHGFGFGHSYEPYFDPYYGYSAQDIHYLSDLMFPRLYCQYNKGLQEKYISCLKYIYSNAEVGNCYDVSFLGGCPAGTYEVEGTEWCCPEPNMIIEGEYCVFEDGIYSSPQAPTNRSPY
ncbi:MAG: hypothetical protein KJ600_06385 [Nanoarchaeota archaeon]|nr:hypothetical protein [Nanoarchaeota archaeon]MBU1104153.1 hypothetical protein [Nanoarchaeota archaeon]